MLYSYVFSGVCIGIQYTYIVPYAKDLAFVRKYVYEKWEYKKSIKSASQKSDTRFYCGKFQLMKYIKNGSLQTSKKAQQGERSSRLFLNSAVVLSMCVNKCKF